MKDNYLEFMKLCLDIEMQELETKLADPQTQLSLELARLTNPQAYYQTMAKIEETREKYYNISKQLELVRH